ncbi:4-hydroxythreonine-4-phosphate dehydrogenase PdxA [Haloferula sp. A504]|uniref:4-hydroxythreonine-4-phosphate dehydrogenase PdxA n=1 Tax=Haloferula sp. A504 TaxID=3373601 RepID=UPI0031C370E2|nr:4-hydroxythreonine-4-phosphate dehydrogenase PdxA [Verrucomicrobiaceae bacterium E54]
MSRPRVAVTLGDPAGIGPEVIAAALESGALPGDVDFIVLGDPSCGVPGKPDEASARESLRALEDAAQKLKSGEVAAVVTGPASKSALERVGFSFPGQTEFFAAALGCDRYAMCLSGDRLTVGLATIHVPLSSVPGSLTPQGIVESGSLLAEFVRRRTGRRPRIAVAGLNPHAGEDGRFGQEESLVIAPAIAQLQSLDIADFTGPAVPDAVFREAVGGRFDAVLAMYHDQGLIPLKLLDFDTAVNVTLGLSRPRTSPDHGTAYDIAGKGIARHQSMLRAMQLAAELALNE